MIGVEIERRFLVDGRSHRPWIEQNEGVLTIAQVYLPDGCLVLDERKFALSVQGQTLVEGIDHAAFKRIEAREGWAVRLRQTGERGTLTLKAGRRGALAFEEEFDVELALVKEHLLDAACPSLVKSRYLFRGTDGRMWEIDEFEGHLAGLIIAEVELEDEHADVHLPDFLGMELTHCGPEWSSHGLASMAHRARHNGS